MELWGACIRDGVSFCELWVNYTEMVVVKQQAGIEYLMLISTRVLNLN